MEASEDRSLQVVIVSYRCEPMLRDCLTSLRLHPASDGMSVHVVDNASGDGTAEMVAREFSEVELTVNEDNLGFGAANNQAIRMGDSAFVLALNPDTWVGEGALDRMLDLIAARPRVGIAGPALYTPEGTFDHAAKRSFPTPLSAIGHFTKLGRRSGARSELAAYTAVDVEDGPVDAVNGAFMLIRRRALDQVGGFDEGYWMYMEDLDLCYRFRQAGWLSWYHGPVAVVHVKGGTTGGGMRSPRLTYAFHRGMFRFYRKHYAPARNPLYNAAIYVGIGLKLLWALTFGRLHRRIASARDPRRTRATAARGVSSP